MKRNFHLALILVALVVLLLGWIAAGYNRLVSSREEMRTKWSQVEGTYQRRFDLIPNLVASVQGASDFERKTFLAITEARSGWVSAGDDREKRIAAAQKLDSVVSGLRINIENYPVLKATDAYRDLMAEIAGTENRINVARSDYNEAVKNYNILVQRFPSMLLARFFGYEPEVQFKAESGAEKAPTVSFPK